MSDHARLAALRRLTVERGATKAEAATAKRLADALEAKVGTGQTRQPRRKAKMVLPEPPAARTRRVWGIRLDLAIDKACWVFEIACTLFVGLTALLLLMMLTTLFGLDHSRALQHQIVQLFFYKYVILAVVSCFAIVIGGPIAFASWWLSTTRGERLGPSLAFIGAIAPPALIGIATFIALGQLERAFSSSNPLIFLSLFGMAYLLISAWIRWVHPGIERWLNANFKMG